MKNSLNENNAKTICIIGLGQIGSRHLQALLKCDFNVSIFCVDLNVDSISKARSLIPHELPKHIKSIHYLSDIKDLPTEIDLAILATSSDIRLKVLKSLLAYSRTNNIIFEKVLFQNLSHLDEASELLNKAGTKSWVNCPRRSWPIYKEIKDYIDGKDNIFLDLKGGNWGLACNSIHFIDLFEWLTNSSVKKINSNDLDSNIFDSKRNGFVEFSGKLEVDYEKGNKLILDSNYQQTKETFKIQLSGKGFNLEILESAGKFILRDENQIISKHFQVPYQSELTNLFVKDIFYKKDCCLPTFSESHKQHSKMLGTFHNHYEKFIGKKVEYCPIT